MGGAVGDRKGGRGLEIHGLGNPEDIALGRHHLLGEGAVGHDRHHPVAGHDRGHTVADFGHRAGQFEPRRERMVGALLIGAGDHQRVGEVDRRRGDRHPDMAGGDRGRGDVAQDEVGRTARFRT